jgi:hypothetical protein
MAGQHEKVYRRCNDGGADCNDEEIFDRVPGFHKGPLSYLALSAIIQYFWKNSRSFFGKYGEKSVETTKRAP